MVPDTKYLLAAPDSELVTAWYKSSALSSLL